MKVRGWELCIIDMPKLLPEVLATEPTRCSMNPFSGSFPLPEPTLFMTVRNAGVTVTFPEPSMPMELAISMSMLSTIGVLPSVMFGLKERLVVIGPATVFCTIVRDIGSIYVTDMDAIVMLAPV